LHNELFRQLVRLEPDNAFWQTRSSLNLGKVGDQQRQLSEAASARASYEEALAIDRVLMRREPGNEDHPRYAAAMLADIGDLYRSDKDKGLLDIQKNSRRSIRSFLPINLMRRRL
jgi:hypothetical protein